MKSVYDIGGMPDKYAMNKNMLEDFFVANS
jgi:hypothetical protein